MKYIFLIIGIFAVSFSAFSQKTAEKKYDFAYKTVDGHDIMATIYLPESDTKVPVLIYFHGGGFIFGNRNQGLESGIKEKLLANKIAVISADYRLVPETKLAEILMDANDMLAWVKTNGNKNFNIDTEKIAVAGGSAGGYLALSTGFDPATAPNAIIAISSPTGFSTEGIETGDLSLLKDIPKDSIVSYGDYSSRMDVWRWLNKNKLATYAIFGFDLEKEPQKLNRYTLTNNIKSIYPPTLIIHAKNDRSVKFDDAKAFYEFLEDKNIEAELYVVENGHSSELINQHPESVDAIIAFLNKHFNR